MSFPKGWEHYDQRSGKFKHECAICKRVFLAKKRTGVKFCSATCRKRSSNGHKDFVTCFRCKHCGGSGFTPQPFQHPEYCSNACRQAAYRQRRSDMLHPVHTFKLDGDT